jgi:Na+/melibiose symporter-like transporter
MRLNLEKQINLKDIFAKLFINTKVDEKDIELNSQKNIMYSNILTSLIYTLMTGTFITGYATYLGASDSFTGIISVVPIVTAIIQVFVPLLFERIEKRKLLSILLYRVYLFLVISVIFIPSIIRDSGAKLYWLMILYVTAFLIYNFLQPQLIGWQMDIIPENFRPSYYAQKDSYVFAGNIVISLIMGEVIDFFKANGSEYYGFLAVYIITSILAILELYYIIKVKEVPNRTPIRNIKFKNILVDPIKDDKFKKVLMLTLLWNFSYNFASPYFTVYMIKYLDLDYSFIMLCIVVSSLASIFMIKGWGKYASREGWVKALYNGIYILGVTYLSWCIIDRSNYNLLLLLHAFSGTAWSCINIAMINVIVMYAPFEGRSKYLGLNAAISGIITLVSVTISGNLLDYMDNVVILGFNKMQLLFIITAIMVVLTTRYLKTFQKERILK